MVSKVAAFALVIIVACPILLGYALNLNEVTETAYTPSEDSVNATQYLTTGTSYTYAHGDIYKMNTNFALQGIKQLPTYNTISANSSSYPLTKAIYYNQSWGGAVQSTDYLYFYEQFDYNPATSNQQITLYAIENGSEVQLYSVPYTHSIYYTKTTNEVFITYYDGSQDLLKYRVDIRSLTKIVLTSLAGTADVVTVETYSPNRFVNLADGWYYANTPVYRHSNNNDEWPGVRLPNYTSQYTFTVDLDSITASNYKMHFNIGPRISTNPQQPMRSMELAKTTTNGVVSWTLKNECDTAEPVTNLYYNQYGSGNTYQFTISADQEYDQSAGKYYIVMKVKASCIGVWPTNYGLGNPYKTYDLEYYIKNDPNMAFSSPLTEDDLSYWVAYFKADNNARTPTMRLEDAYYRAFEYQVIEDQHFQPSAFKENPATTLKNVKMYGPAISFGGLTFPVKSGNIILNGHQVPIEGITFSSVLVDQNNNIYENKIGNTVVSTMHSPSDIRFSGVWSADVITTSMEQKTYTKTEWTPGEFAWNGLDQNFLMVGLLCSIGVFIALGLALRRARSALWPLLIVCGGAAMLFFIML